MRKIFLLFVLLCTVASVSAVNSIYSLNTWDASGALNNLSNKFFQTTADPNIFEIDIPNGIDLHKDNKFGFKIEKDIYLNSDMTFLPNTWTKGSSTGTYLKDYKIGSDFTCKKIVLFFYSNDLYFLDFQTTTDDTTTPFNLLTDKVPSLNKNNVFKKTANPNIFEIDIAEGVLINLYQNFKFKIGNDMYYGADKPAKKDNWFEGLNVNTNYWYFAETFTCKKIVLFFYSIGHYFLDFQTTTDDKSTPYFVKGGPLHNKRFIRGGSNGIFRIEMPNGFDIVADNKEFTLGRTIEEFMATTLSDTPANTWSAELGDNRDNGHKANTAIVPGKYYKLYAKPIFDWKIQYYFSTIPLKVSEPTGVGINIDQDLNNARSIYCYPPKELTDFNGYDEAGKKVSAEKNFIKGYTVTADDGSAVTVKVEAGGRLVAGDAKATATSYTIVCDYIDYEGSTEILHSAPITVPVISASAVKAAKSIVHNAQVEGQPVNSVAIASKIQWTAPTVATGYEILGYKISRYEIDKAKTDVTIYGRTGVLGMDLITKIKETSTGKTFDTSVSFDLAADPIIAQPVSGVAATQLKRYTEAPADGTSYSATLNWTAPTVTYPCFYKLYFAKGAVTDLTNFTPYNKQAGEYTFTALQHVLATGMDKYVAGSSTSVNYLVAPVYKVITTPASSSEATFNLATYLSATGTENELRDASGLIKVEFNDNSSVQTGVEGVETGKVAIYPNPTMGEINISGDEAINNVRLFTITGAIAGEFNGNGETTLSIDISNVPAGTYFLKVGTKVTKIIKK
ncbi:MAG: T9SS type A sorting domain-containing protein [Muribaculaceae bacterium]